MHKDFADERNASQGLFSAVAQQSDIFKNKPWEDLKNKKLSEKLKWSPPASNNTLSMSDEQLQNKSMVLQLPLTGTNIGTTKNGDDIYSMQPDNMPCLVPGKSFVSNMPVAGKTNKIPSVALIKPKEEPAENLQNLLNGKP